MKKVGLAMIKALSTLGPTLDVSFDRGPPGSQTTPSMITRILIASLAALLAFSSVSCRSRGRSKEKISSTPAAEMEASFKQRWVEKRVAELTATGLGPEMSREKAIVEFETQYGYLKKDAKK